MSSRSRASRKICGKCLGEAFVHEGGVQCGFCIPGIVVRASSMLRQGCTDDREAVKQGLVGHLCRCTGYARILDAIQTAGEAWKNGGKLPRTEPRRHSYFGEDFGMSRNPAFANGKNGNGNGKRNGHGFGIGDSPSRYRGFEQALGERPFVDDMSVPGMLHGGMVLSEHPRAKVNAIDLSEAQAMPGVVRIFTAADVPGERGTGLNYPDLPIFVAIGETTCCVGDFLAMVVADTAFHARQAADKVKVDYTVLEPVTDPFAAMEPGAPQVHPPGNLWVHGNMLDTTAFSRGDVEAAFAQSAHIIEQTWTTQPIEPAFLEPEACLAMPQGDGIKFYSQSQGSTYDHKMIADILKLPMEKVEVELAASGGAFGAKEELTIQGQTALAAFLLQRPVKTVLTRKQSTQHHCKRHPMTLKYKVGADAEGHLLAVRARIVGDTGGYAGTGGKCLLRAACHSCGVYRVPNVDVKSKAVFTNNPTSGAMRGFGSNQAQFAMEGVMDMLAEKVGVDGWEIRMRNILNPGDAFATGQIMRESVRGMRVALEAVKDIYKNAKYAGLGCGIKSTGIGNGAVESGYSDDSRSGRPAPGSSDRLHGNGPGRFHDGSPGGVRRDGAVAGHHDRALGQGTRRQVRRGVGIARHHAQLRRGAARGTKACRRLERIAARKTGGPRIPRRIRLRLHDPAGHSRSAEKSDDAHDVQLRLPARDPRRRRAHGARRRGSRRGPRHQSRRLARGRSKAACTWAWATRSPKISRPRMACPIPCSCATAASWAPSKRRKST